jgi:hypothetical protein
MSLPEKLGLPLTEVEERLAAARQKLYDVAPNGSGQGWMTRC